MVHVDKASGPGRPWTPQGALMYGLIGVNFVLILIIALFLYKSDFFSRNRTPLGSPDATPRSMSTGENLSESPSSSMRVLSTGEQFQKFLFEDEGDEKALYRPDSRGGPFGSAVCELERRGNRLTISYDLGEFRSACKRGSSNGKLTACKSNLKNIGTAMEMYSCDNKGRYPTSLFLLTPNYLRVLPTCPAAGFDTYSQGYKVTVVPDCYTVMCTGHHHAESGMPENFPKYDAIQGLSEEP